MVNLGANKSHTKQSDEANKKHYPTVEITDDMLRKARELEEKVRVDRTQASPVDTLTGILGEFVFAQWLFGDWRMNRVGNNKGCVDFPEIDVEVKTSAVPMSDKLHLLVREEYAEKRKPDYYVQVIISIQDREKPDIVRGTKAYLVGWATSEEVDKAISRDMGTKSGKEANYKCRCIPLVQLHSMEELREKLAKRHGVQ